MVCGSSDRRLGTAAQPLAALRRVIDVSSDGCQKTGEVAMADARDAAVSRGLTVNGLPITAANKLEIEDWYRANVVGGPGSFLVVADRYDAFATAFRHKLAGTRLGAGVRQRAVFDQPKPSP